MFPQFPLDTDLGRLGLVAQTEGLSAFKLNLVMDSGQKFAHEGHKFFPEGEQHGQVKLVLGPADPVIFLALVA